MKKRFAALCLTCSCPAVPVRTRRSGAGTQRQRTAPVLHGNTSVTIPSDGTLSFDQIGPRVKANNLTLKAAQESLKSAEAMDWDEAIDEMEDAIDAMELQLDMLLTGSSGQLIAAEKALADSLSKIEISNNKISGLDELIENVVAVSSLTALSEYSKMQAASLETSLESMEDQLDDLKDQKEDYQKPWRTPPAKSTMPPPRPLPGQSPSI